MLLSTCPKRTNKAFWKRRYLAAVLYRGGNPRFAAAVDGKTQLRIEKKRGAQLFFTNG